MALFTYRNEAAFSKALVTAMRNRDIFVQRIESGSTGRGVPDIYAIIGTTPVWIELKRVRHTSQRFEEIPWRPGQQSWLMDVTRRGQQAITLCCFDDRIVKISHKNLHLHNVVDIEMWDSYYTLKEVLQ